MSGIIKSVLYRALHSKALRIIFIIGVICTILGSISGGIVSLIGSIIVGFKIDATGAGMSMMSRTNFWSIGMLVALGIAIFCTGDFNNNTIRSSLLCGQTRKSVAFSVLVGNVLTGMLMVTALFAVSAVATLIEYKSLDLTNALTIILFNYVACIPLICLTTFLSFLTRSTGGTIGIVILIFYMLPIIVLSVDEPAFVEVCSTLSVTLFTNTQLFYQEVSEHLLTGSILYPAATLVYSALAMLTFSKVDFK